MSTPTRTSSSAPIAGLEYIRRGKVRDIYAHGDDLLLVATDRVSAFDVVLSDTIPGKGKLLTAISTFWFEKIASIARNHLITSNVEEIAGLTAEQRQKLRGRTMLCRRHEVVPFEFVVRGWITGSGWKSYQNDRTICGIELPEGLQESDRLPEPILTPTTKDEHDEPVTFEQVADAIGSETAKGLRELSLRIYDAGATYAASRGIIMADTKFEFALQDGEPVLIDEVLTPDSSRFWPAAEVQPGETPPSFDKQIVRNYLLTLDWNKKPPGPALPAEIVNRTLKRYMELYELLTEEPASSLLEEK